MENERERDVIAGRNAVTEALKAGRPIDSILVRRGEKNGSVSSILRMAEQAGIPVKEVDSRKRDGMCGGENHQGDGFGIPAGGGAAAGGRGGAAAGRETQSQCQRQEQGEKLLHVRFFLSKMFFPFIVSCGDEGTGKKTPRARYLSNRLRGVEQGSGGVRQMVILD